jgi:hypothetical protein
MKFPEPRGRGGIRENATPYREREPSMRSIMLALAATFIFSGTMAGITTVRAQDSTTVIKHDDGDKTVIKKYNDDDADKKVIIKKHDD